MSSKVEQRIEKDVTTKQSGSFIRNKAKTLRIVVALLVLGLAVFAFHADVAIGTLCTICPVGFLGISAASRSIPWALLPGVLIVLALTLVFGRVFCSWLCTSSLLKNIFGGHKPRGLRGKTGVTPEEVKSSRGCTIGKENSKSDAKTCSYACGGDDSLGWKQFAILGVLLIVSFIVRFPVFCLFCPIGLAFGTLWAVNRVFVLLEPGWELIIFPAILIAELFLFKRWCSAVCPIGAVFSLVEKARTKLKIGFKPRVDCSTCISDEGCTVCATVCPEDIDLPNADATQLEKCTYCLDCVEHCPTGSLLALKKPAGEEEAVLLAK